ncbi:hypothetical protein HaLaN_11003, partial [Haematococcus lacustris]
MLPLMAHRASTRNVRNSNGGPLSCCQTMLASKALGQVLRSGSS